MIQYLEEEGVVKLGEFDIQVCTKTLANRQRLSKEKGNTKTDLDGGGKCGSRGLLVDMAGWC